MLCAQNSEDMASTLAIRNPETQETELIRTQYQNTALLIALIARAQQPNDPETTESILYCNVMVPVDPAEMALIDLLPWVVGSRLWEDLAQRS